MNYPNANLITHFSVPYLIGMLYGVCANHRNENYKIKANHEHKLYHINLFMFLSKL